MTPDAESVEELVLACRDREDDLVKLLSRYRPYLRLLARQAIGADVRRREDESDILQQTELDVSQAIAGFKGATEPEFSAWIKQILRRNVATACRNHRAGKRDVGREVWLDDTESTASVTWRQPVGREATPSLQARRGEAALKLAAAIEALPPNQSNAVRMRHLDGMKIDEVAAALGVTAGAAAGLIRRGVETLRDRMQGDTSWL